MKRMIAVGAVLAVVAGASPAAAPAYLYEAEAAGAVMDGTLIWANGSFTNAFSPWGVTKCPPGSDPCWRNDGSTYNDVHRTGDLTVWVTANHFAIWVPDVCQRRWRTQWRARAVEAGNGSVSIDNLSLVEGVTKVSGSC